MGERTDQSFRPEDRREMTAEGREVVELFQRAKTTSDKQERLQLLIQLRDKLAKMIDRPSPIAWMPDDTLEQIFIEGSSSGTQYFSVETGTSGERIYFLEKHPDSFQRSPDNKVKWMYYPWHEDKIYGKLNYKRFLHHFGNDVVDITTALEAKNE